MAKKIAGYVKLQVPAGAANPSPPIGPALGQRGLNIMEFCKAFNAKTAQIEKGMPIPVIITAYQDRSFTFEMKQPPVSYFLKKAAKIDKGSQDARQGLEVRHACRRDQIREIAEKKMVDLNCDTVESAMAMIEGSARSMGLEVAGKGRASRWRMMESASAPPARASTATKLYPIQDAVKLMKDRAKAKFDETVEVSMNLGVDPRHADQMVRGVCNLPNGSGRTVRVAVFARGAKADEAKAAGADIVGAEDLVETVNGGTIEFDRCIATPDMMPLVGRLGKVLGPRGLMPNPKVGTVTMDVAGAVKAAKGGAVEFRVEKAGIVHAGIGKASFDDGKLVENIKAFADAVAKAKPSGAKGTYIQRIAISSTMGPGVKVDPASVLNA